MNWEYVIAGYAITVVAIGVYAWWVRHRTKVLRRTLSDEGGE